VVQDLGLLPTTLSATFPGLATSFSASAYYLHPNWTGDFNDGYDVALVKLNASVATQAYDILRTEIAGTATGNIAGYGRSGTGNTGDVLPSGTLRQGDNTFGEAYWLMNGSPYAFDFDNGLFLQNIIYSGFGLPSDYGLGLDEVLIAPGFGRTHLYRRADCRGAFLRGNLRHAVGY